MPKTFLATSCVSPSYKHDKFRVPSLITSFEVAFCDFLSNFHGWRDKILKKGGFGGCFMKIFCLLLKRKPRQCQQGWTRLIFYTNDVQYRRFKLTSLCSHDAPCERKKALLENSTIRTWSMFTKSFHSQNSMKILRLIQSFASELTISRKFYGNFLIALLN